MSPYQQILYSKENRVATITLNRPEKLNAYSETMVHEILAALDEAAISPIARRRRRQQHDAAWPGKAACKFDGLAHRPGKLHARSAAEQATNPPAACVHQHHCGPRLRPKARGLPRSGYSNPAHRAKSLPRSMKLRYRP